MSSRIHRSVVQLSAASLLATLLGASCHSSEARPAHDPTQNERPLKVTTQRVVELEVVRFVPLTGTLTAEQRTQLTANSNGRVVKTYVERGQAVVKGAVIAQLDIRSALATAAEARASVDSARTQLKAARTECERYDSLVARGAIPKQEHDRQTASCNQQLAALAMSEARESSVSLVVGDGTIRAPFSGVITERLVTPGDYVQAASKVATLLVSNPLRLELSVPERRIEDIQMGALVTFSPAAMEQRTFSGTVKYVSPEIRTSTRDVVIEATVPNADGALMPGMFVAANLHAGSSKMPVVPKAAVFTSGEDDCLYVVEDEHLLLRIVKLGRNAGEDVSVTKGLALGELVVLNPSPSMFDGAPVE